MGIEQDITKFLDGIIGACQQLKSSLHGGPQPAIAATAVAPPIVVEPAKTPEEEFQFLKTVLESDNWPEAVNKNLICDPSSDQDKLERGRGIISLVVDDDLKDKKILDFGCGEGHCAYCATEQSPSISVGYDLIEHPRWKKFESKENLLLTSDFGLVTQKGPFDIIVLFDVIDHLKNSTDQVDILKKMKSVLAPQGKIYMRCHPLTSRHATHLYHNLNKAYAHLVFTEEELRKIVPESIYKENNISSPYPLKGYDQIIKDSGLQVFDKSEVREKPEDFFKTPMIADRIKRNTGHKDFPYHQMSLQFINFVLQN